MTFPLPTLGCTITSTGITAPSLADILTSLQTSMGLIYGTDVTLDNSTQDGQLLGVIAQALSDQNDACIATYLAQSPQTAQGVGLSSIVKINGIARLASSNSTVNLTVAGNIGAVITNGIANDTGGNSWALPATVTIDSTGSVLVTATCTVPGAINAAIGTVNIIGTPTRGWNSVTNASAASPGAPVETDAALRIRQAASVALPSLSPLDATIAAVEDLAGVSAIAGYENPTGATDSNGLPPHSIALVVTGGDALTIANTILNKKTPGCFTYGTTSENITDAAGVPHVISFFVTAYVRIVVAATIKAGLGYTSATGTAIKQAIADFINNDLGIGQNVKLAQLYLPAQLYGGAGSNQYELLTLTIAAYPAAPTGADVTIPFNMESTCAVGDITLTVT